MKRVVSHHESFGVIVPPEDLADVFQFMSTQIGEDQGVSFSCRNGKIVMFFSTTSTETADAFEAQFGHLEDFDEPD